METVNGVSLGEDKGGPPPPSPLTGCYLLVVIGEPHSEEHKDIILQKVAKGLLSWDLNECLVDLEKELAIITGQGLEGEEARYGERLIQFASENLVTEILIHPAVSTLSQCVRNLLSSFTRHRHIIHAGYTFQGNGSWALQDGTFSYSDFAEAFQEIEVQRVIHAYENGISIDLHCTPEGDWSRLPKEYFTKSCKVRVNPTDVLTTGSPSISRFTKYLEPFLVPTVLEDILESSDVVGNIRFSRPTLYVFPGGQGDAALFGINGFNMLLDGGYSRKACFWDFVRHLDRLDAVMMTRLNNSSVSGVSSVLKRKKQGAVYPQVGHFFCNIQERKSLLSPDGDKDKDPLIISLLEEGQSIIQDLRHLNLSPQSCYRDSEPIILYHKVGHGTLNMYVLSPDKNSREVKDFLQKWSQSDSKLFVGSKPGKEFSFPLQNLVSICALLVWQPANPNDTITRILYPGSTPQKKIFEGLDRLKNLEYMKHPICTVKSIAPAKKTKQDVIEKLAGKESKAQVITERKMENKPLIEDSFKNGEMNGDVIREKQVKKSDSQESDKEKKIRKLEEGKKIEESRKNEKTDDIGKLVENGEKAKPKQKPGELKTKGRGESQHRKKPTIEKKGPPTPKKSVENKTNGDAKERERRGPQKPSPNATPAKSTKDANNRKVIESKKAPLKKETVPKPAPADAKAKPERKPISRRPKTTKGPQSPMKKMTNGVQKPDSLSKRGKLDKEGTTDSSTVSTPSADQESILKKDISKLTPEEIQQLKDKELEELKEEQDAIKEIEAVFRKGEGHVEETEPGVRKIKEVSIDDNLDTEEYLIIEKEEIEHDSLDQETKEDEMQKLVRDSEESEKQRKLSAEDEELKVDLQEKKTSQIDEERNGEEEITSKISEDLDSRKQQIVSPDDKVAPATDKKELAEEEAKEIVESHPEEKVSANIESGATTTAPTLPEDERITLDEIKEDNGQAIEEKHVKEETKEKEVPIIQLPPKSQQDSQSKQPPVVGIPLDKQKHVRDIVKTPDEVADLPVHEEADYHEFHGDEKKSNEVDANIHGKEEKKEDKETVSPRKYDVPKDEISKPDKDIDQKTAEISKEGEAKPHKEPEHDIKEVDKKKEEHVDVATDAALTAKQPPLEVTKDTQAEKEPLIEQKQVESESKIKDSVIETIGIVKIDEVAKNDILEKADVETKEKSDQDNNLFLVEDKLKESIDDEWVVITKEEEEALETAQEADKILEAPTELLDKAKDEKVIKTDLELAKTEDLKHALSDKVVSDFISKEIEHELSQLVQEEKSIPKDHKEDTPVSQELIPKEPKLGKDVDIDSEHYVHEIRKEDEIDDVIEQDKEDIKALIEEADKKSIKEQDIDKKSKDDNQTVKESEEVVTEATIDEKVSAIKESKHEIAMIDDNLQELRKEVVIPIDELHFDNVKDDLTEVEEPTQNDLRQELKAIVKFDDKLNELKSLSDEMSSGKDEIKVEKSTRSPEHAESVILSDSSPEDDGPRAFKELDIDKSELGRKSPAEREEDVKKIVVSVAEVLKSEAPLEEFHGKIPFTQELRETHITTQDSPILEAKIIKTDDIPPIPEEPLEEESKAVKVEKEDISLDGKESVVPSLQYNSDSEESPDDKLDKDDDAGTVHRMLVTASSEDGGEETEICPPGTIIFSKSSESSGRSSPEPSQKTQSQKSSIVETLSDTMSTVKQVTEKDIMAEGKDLEAQIEEKMSDLTKDSSKVQDKFDTLEKGPDEIKPQEIITNGEIEKATKSTEEDLKSVSDKLDSTKDKLKDEKEIIQDKLVDVKAEATTEEVSEVKEHIDHSAKDLLKDTKGLTDDKIDTLPKDSDIDGQIIKEDTKMTDKDKSDKSVSQEEMKISMTVAVDAPKVMEEAEPHLTTDEPIQVTSEMQRETKETEDRIQKVSDKLEELTETTTSGNIVDEFIEKSIGEKLGQEIQVEKDVEKVSKASDHLKTEPTAKISDISDATAKTEDVIENNLEQIEEKATALSARSTHTVKDSEHSTEVVDKISESLPGLKDGDQGKPPTPQRRESIIEKAQEFLEKSEEALESAVTSISTKAHSVLDDIIKPEVASKSKEELTDSKILSGKSSPHRSEHSPQVVDKISDSLPGLKDGDQEKPPTPQRRESIIEKAQQFIEKSEEALESAVTSISTKAHILKPEVDAKTKEELTDSKILSGKSSPHPSEHSRQVVDKISDSLPGLKDGEQEKPPTPQRRESIIEKAQEFIEKSEAVLESAVTSISTKAHSVLDDIIKPEVASKSKEDLTDSKILSGKSSPHPSEDGNLDILLIPSSKSTPEPKKIKDTIDDTLAEDHHSDKTEISPEPKEIDKKERRASIVEAAEDFFEKSEKTLESVFSAVGDVAKSTLGSILSEEKIGSLGDQTPQKVDEKIMEVTDKPVLDKDKSKEDHIADKKVTPKEEQVIDQELGTTDTATKSEDSTIDDLEKDSVERKDSIIEAAEEFIEKSEKSLESVFSAIGGAAKSALHSILPEEKIKTEEPDSKKDDAKDQMILGDKAVEQIEKEKQSVKDVSKVTEKTSDIDKPTEDINIIAKDEKSIHQGVETISVEANSEEDKKVDPKSDVSERRSSVIEAAEEFIEKSEKSLESVFSAIGGTIKSSLDDILPKEKTKTDEICAKKDVAINKAEEDQPVGLGDKTIQEIEKEKHVQKDKTTEEQGHSIDLGEVEKVIDKELDIKETAAKFEGDKRDALERRDSVIEAAEKFIEKSEKTIESVFSAIGGAVKSAMEDILPETGKPKTKEGDDLSEIEKDQLTLGHKTLPEIENVEKEVPQITEHATVDIDKLKKEHIVDTKITGKDEKVIDDSLDIKETEAKLEEVKKDSLEKRDSITEAAGKFIEKSEKTIESVFSAIGGAVKSTLDNILPEEKIKTDETIAKKDKDLEIARKDQLIHGHKEEIEKEVSKVTEQVTLDTDKPKDDYKVVDKIIEKGEQAIDTKDERDVLKKDSPERKGSIVEAVDEFVEKSERTIESAFSATGGTVKSVLHDILPEEKVKTDEPSTEKDLEKSGKDQLIHGIENEKEPKKDEIKVVEKATSGRKEDTIDTQIIEKDVKEIDQKHEAVGKLDESKKEPVGKDSSERRGSIIEVTKDAKVTEKDEKLIDPALDTKDTAVKSEEGKSDSSERRSSIIEVAEQFIEKSEKTLESALHDILPEEKVKTTKPSSDKDISDETQKPQSAPADKIIPESEKVKQSEQELSKATDTTVLDKDKPKEDSTLEVKESKDVDKDGVSVITDSPASDEFKISKETKEKGEKDIDDQARHESETVEKIGDQIFQGKEKKLPEETRKMSSEDLSKLKDAMLSENDQSVDEFKVDKDTLEREKKQTGEEVSYQLKHSNEELFEIKDSEPESYKVDKETIEKEEKEIDDRVMHISESVHTVSDLAQSILFEKCHPSDEVSLDQKDHKPSEQQLEKKSEGVSKPEEEFKVDKETLRKEEKQIDEEIDQLKRSYEDLSKIAESTSFEKCHPSDEYKVDKEMISKGEKQIDDRITQISENFEEVSNLTKSIQFEKCHPTDDLKTGPSEKVDQSSLEETLSGEKSIIRFDEFKVDKDATEKEKKHTEEEMDLSKSSPATEASKVDKEVILKEEKEIDDQAMHVSKALENISDLAKSISFDKCHLPDEFKVDKEILEREEKQIEEEVDQLRRSYEDLSKLTESISFEKCQPLHEFKVEQPILDSNRVEHLTRDEKKDREKTDISKEEQESLASVSNLGKTVHVESSHVSSMVGSELSDTSKLEKPKESADTKHEILATKDSIVLDDQPIPSQTEKCEKESMEKTSLVKGAASLKVDPTEHKKLSISDVEICIKTDVDRKDASQSFLDNERSVICDITDAKIYKAPEEGSVCQDGASIVAIKPSTETESSSDKSSPDLELSGKTTPPTVPISPVAKDVKSPSSKLDSGLSEHTETDEEDLSTKSQVAHSQSDLDELDMKMDPMSMSFYGALPEEQLQEGEQVPATYLYEITKAKYTADIKIGDEEGAMKEGEMSLMTASFIGELPTASTETKPSESEDDKPKKDAVDSWGKPLGLPAPTYLYEVTKARFSSQSQSEEIDLMTSSFIGDELPTSSKTQQKVPDPMTTSVYFGEGSDSSYDPIASWGKPLGLPSPAPPNNNDKGTPKKEKKLPAYVTAKNKLNDDRKRAESPSKLRAKKVNPVYVDLTYVPHHGNHYYSYVDFFKRIRARYYVFSGLEPSRQVYDALLEAKQTWDDKELDVTIIPTYDTDILGYWVAENEELLSKFKIDLAPSASRCTINLQDHETSCSAYRLEF